MFFNHAALLNAPKRCYKHFESYFDSAAAKNIEEHQERYYAWIYRMGDGIKIISIETRELSKADGFYCQRFKRRYKYKFRTTIAYAEIGDPRTGRL